MNIWRRFKCSFDWHDYPDGTSVRRPVHGYIYTCRHCKRQFQI
jgi:hypothetical protein